MNNIDDLLQGRGYQRSETINSHNNGKASRTKFLVTKPLYFTIFFGITSENIKATLPRDSRAQILRYKAQVLHQIPQEALQVWL